MRSFINFVLLFNFAEAFYKVTMIQDKTLHGCSFQNTSETTIGNCLAKCLQNCTCRAFRMCGEDKTCSLCLSTSTSLKIKEKQGDCGYFAFERNHQHGYENGGKSGCFQDTNCCLTSQTCFNDGVCKPSYPNDILHSPRFTCDCPPGYRGNRCKQPIKSCRGYVKASGHDPPASGNYTIMDHDNKPFQVFCNFVKMSVSDTTVSWTLIQSYRFENKTEFKAPFFNDNPKNAEDPNWESYRLSLSRMKSIQKDSSKWRMTCRFDTDGLNKTDYMEGLKSQVDILTYNASDCMNVEFINVRGYECAVGNCQAFLIQKFNRPFHHDSYRSGKKKCSNSHTGNKCSADNSGNNGEDNFGRYQDGCVNPDHRCSKNKVSTTQTWLGA
ncbi:uncharacterized protein LOC114516132 isoform X2 [Dendronephthya gigantea]|uniref:uncharacterized protein LOC114516132 isoform X2 n=1 Tax=Dendronephthya gigantea TaxID=151771 RepID=UPI0010691A75|nr:uncharacterized protein LOC114516132 isoform X2 [Dendronephthya gigantea]